MRRLFWLGLFLLLATPFALAPGVAAGGWSVVTLDRFPQAVAPGSEFQIGFMVRQHGMRPLTIPNARVRLTNPGTGDQVTVYAQPDGPPGHHRAVITLPASGRWEWVITAFEGDHVMPPLSVQLPGQQPSVSGTARSTPDPRLWVPLAMIAALSAAGALLLQTTQRASARAGGLARPRLLSR